MAKEQFGGDWLRGSADLMVLSVIARGAQYGYSIAREIERASERQIRLSPGTLYPLLHRLEADGLIRGHWDQSSGRPRKWYELSAKGRARLQKQTRSWEQFAECLSRILSPGSLGAKE